MQVLNVDADKDEVCKQLNKCADMQNISLHNNRTIKGVAKVQYSLTVTL